MRVYKYATGILLLFLLIQINGKAIAQSQKDSLLIADGKSLVQENRMVWKYDQELRKYLDYQTFNKHS